MFSALRHRDYRLYYFGQGLSLIGSWMQTTALAWLAYSITGQSSWTASVAIGMILPTAILAPLAGILADRVPKRRLVLASQTAFGLQAAALAAYALWGSPTAWGLVGFAWLGGAVQAIDLPARLSFLKDLTSREDLPNAVALNSVQFNLARALGPALAGWIISVADPALCFAANAASYLAVLGSLAFIRAVGEPAQLRFGETPPSFFAVLRDGGELGFFIFLATGAALFGWPMLSLLPQVAADGLGWHAAGHGWLLSAVGGGAMVSAMGIAAWGNDANLWRRIRVGLLLTALGQGVLAGSSALADAAVGTALAGAALAGMGLIMVLATAQGAVQQLADDRSRGKAMALWTMGLSLATPLGNAVFGPLADSAGHPFALAVMMAGMVALLLPSAFGTLSPISLDQDGIGRP
ncbi:MAG: MFS transporter [Planctomycetota bacterium]